MSDISIQFHGLPEEIVPFAAECVASFKLHVVKMRFSPFEALEIEPDELGAIVADVSVRRLAFTLKQPLLPAASGNHFLDQNRDALILDIGRKSEQGLQESGLSARTDRLHVLSTWKVIAGRLKAMTKAGAIAVNTQTGAQARIRTHRYTQGAKALELAGVAILPLGGRSKLMLGTA